MKTPPLFLALAVVVCCPRVPAQWVLTSAPYGGDITCLLPCPNGSGGTYLYVGTADGNGMGGGVFRSTDNGVSWTAADTQFPRVAAVSTIAAAPAFTRGMMIFAGTGSGDSPGHGAFVSNNNGKSWTPISQGLPGHHYSPTGYQPILGMAVIPNAQWDGISTIVVATWNRGVYRSTDNGASWAAACEGLPRSYDATTYDIVNCLTVSDANIFAGTWQHGVFLSTDSGASWTPAGNGLPKNYSYVPINCLESHGSNLFAGTFSGIFMSTDNGANWTAANGGLPYGKYSTTLTPISCLFSTGQTLFAGTPDYGIFRSTNNGKEWTPNNAGLPRKSSDTASYTPAGCFASSGQNLFAGIGPDVYRSTDNGTTWSEASIALNNTSCSINAFAITDGNLFAGGAGGLDRSTDNGQTWTPITRQLSSFFARALVTVGKSLFLGRDFSLAGFGTRIPLFPEAYGVSLSTDNGITWTSTNNTGLYLQVHAFVAADPWLLAGTSHGFVATRNYGTTWERINTGLTDTVINALAMKPYARGMVLFAGTSQRGIFRSHPHGNDWTAANVGLTDTSITALAVSESYDDIVFAGTAHGLFRSMNLGANWTPANDGLTDTNISCLLVNGSNAFAGTHEGGVFLSRNNGASWTSFNSGLPPGTTIASLGVAGTNLLAGSWGCVWRRPLADITTSIAPQATEFPHAFSLSQNYPNPFNPSTTIHYGLPERSHVSLAVYNTLGQQVTVLQEGEQEAGYHDVKFDASTLPSGVYFYRLQAGIYGETRRLCLVR
jgi:photosystem II stability/assembly factor-like uncharacterized protein